jgi:hypothetical protein
VILFLDFDGVLHPEKTGQVADFSRRPHFWRILRACSHAQVVFSTSWRSGYTIENLIEFATQGGGEDLAHRFVGATPTIIREEGAYNTGRFYCREAECRAWLVGNGQPHHPWLALDDFAPFFSSNCQTLYLVDQRTGLTDADATAIIERLT